MTITRALSELKLLKNKIEKKINECKFVDCINKMRKYTLFTNISKEDFESQVKSQYDSIKDLIKLRKKIKEAVIISNSKTFIKIGKQEMSVAEAIDKKESIELEKALLNKMRASLVDAKRSLENNNIKLEEQIISLLQQNLSKDRIANKDDYEKISTPIKEDHQLILIDVINIEKEIEKLDEYITEFECEVDFVLSESNAKTEINI